MSFFFNVSTISLSACCAWATAIPYPGTIITDEAFFIKKAASSALPLFTGLCSLDEALDIMIAPDPWLRTGQTPFEINLQRWDQADFENEVIRILREAANDGKITGNMLLKYLQDTYPDAYKLPFTTTTTKPATNTYSNENESLGGESVGNEGNNSEGNNSEGDNSEDEILNFDHEDKTDDSDDESADDLSKASNVKKNPFLSDDDKTLDKTENDKNDMTRTSSLKPLDIVDFDNFTPQSNLTRGNSLFLSTQDKNDVNQTSNTNDDGNTSDSDDSDDESSDSDNEEEIFMKNGGALRIRRKKKKTKKRR